MPAGESVAPRRGPAHDVFRRSFFPEGEVERVLFFTLSVQLAGIGKQFFNLAAGEFAVRVFLVVGFYVKVDASVAFVSETVFQYFFDEFLLLDDVSGSVGLDAWTQRVELLHVFMVAVGVKLNDFHRFQPVQLRLF